MENKSAWKKRILELFSYLKKASGFFARWFFMLLFLFSAAYAVFIWNKYIISAEWSEEQKKKYIEEQSVFSFDRKSYQQVFDFLENKEKQLDDEGLHFTRDVFFPDGF